MRDPCFLSYRWHIRVSYPPTRKYQYRPILHYTVTTRLQICAMLSLFTVHTPNPKNSQNGRNCKYFTANFKCSVISSLSIVKCRRLDHRFLVQAWLDSRILLIDAFQLTWYLCRWCWFQNTNRLFDLK